MVAENERGSNFNIDKFSTFMPLRSDDVKSPRTCTLKALGVTKEEGEVVTKHTETFSPTISGKKSRADCC